MNLSTVRGQWLVAGTTQGSVHIADALTGIFLKRLQHSTTGYQSELYRGVTAIDCLKARNDNYCDSSSNSYNFNRTNSISSSNVVFTGCSLGIIKVWAFNNNNSTNLSKPKINMGLQSSSSSSSWSGTLKNISLRSNQAIATIKMHDHVITALCSKSIETNNDSSVGYNWILASGDANGNICISRGSDKSASSSSSSTTSILRMIQPSIKQTNSNSSNNINNNNNNNDTTTNNNYSNGMNSRNNSRNYRMRSSDNSISISCLSFLHTTNNNNYNSSNSDSSNSNDYLIVGNVYGTIAVIDVTTAIPIIQVDNAHQGVVSRIVKINDNEFISCSHDRCIKLWDLRSKNQPSSLQSPSSSSQSRFISPSQLSVGSSSLSSPPLPSLSLSPFNSYSSLNEVEHRLIGSNDHHLSSTSPITHLVVGGLDNTIILSSTANGLIHSWDLRYSMTIPRVTIAAHSDRVTSLLWSQGPSSHHHGGGSNSSSSSGGDIYSSSLDGTIKSWDSNNYLNTGTIQAYSNDGVVSMTMAMTTSRMGNDIDIDAKGTTTTSIVTNSWKGRLKCFRVVG